MARPPVYYAELKLNGGKLIMRLQEEVREGMYGWNIARHTSTDYELHIFAEGAAMLHLEHSIHSVPQGHAVIIGPNTSHSSKSLPGDTVHFYLNFRAEGDRLLKLLHTAVKDFQVFPVEESTIVLIRQLLEILCGESAYRQELLEALLPPIMLKSLENLGLMSERTTANAINEDQERKNRIEVFFQSDMPYGDDEDRLAAFLGVSRRQLARIMQKYYGMTFREMLLQRRMDHAAWILRHTEDSVTAIAERLNYTSLSAFSQAFRAVHGKTPRQYRAEHR